ncbi:hypothetical protein [Solilutibacter silvestris]|uniref:hypothetical protein n=1 Tax=Solilutibacter silvestris TaxID=1645665 RepID=UPI000CA031E1|nr:hypothetical protein [Lysobacter silvestris]
MISIEFEPQNSYTCECCGKETIRLTRFVTDDGNALAVYYLQYTPSHPDHQMVGLIGLGSWGDKSTPEDRLAFPFRLWETGDNFNVGLMDADESPWADTTYLGRLLNRGEALAHHWKDQVFHITDHIVQDDPEVIAYFSSGQRDA